MSSLSILYCGDLRKGGTCLHRMQALKELGHDIASVDTAPEDVRNRQRRFSYLVRRKLFGPLDLAKANKQIVSKLKQRSYDVLWLDKALTIKPETLQKVKKIQRDCCIVGFVFFFKQKTAYEIYQCDWSSDVCSSDLCNATRARFLISPPNLDLILSKAGSKRARYSAVNLSDLLR